MTIQKYDCMISISLKLKGGKRTRTKMEAVSCSEEKPEIKEPPEKKPNANTNGSSAARKKKISPPSNGKKQGSILSFFGKK